MPENESHAVIVKTRFSLRWRGRTPTREWIASRFDLLRRITLPSLMRQTASAFDWVIQTDPDCYDEVYELFGGISLPSGVVTVIPGRAGLGVTRPELIERVRRGRTMFLTLRLDSDDALAPDCLARVVDAARGISGGGGLINLPAGVALDWRSGDLWRRTFRDHYQGPFHAMLHPTAERLFDTGGDHRIARGDLPVASVGALSWLQTIHAGNLDNRSPAASAADRMKQFVKGAIDAVSGSRLIGDDVTPMGQEEAARLLAEWGIERPG